MQVVKTSAARLFILYSLAILLLVLSLYGLGLRAPFQFDDIANITKNFSIRNFEVYSEIMSRSRWFGELTNKLYFQFAGFNPFYYRIFNIFCHMLTGLSWLSLCYLICKKQKIVAFVSENAFLLTNTSFALFMLHPVQTQTVSYIIQARLEGLATLFIVGSLFLFFSSLFSKSIFPKIILFSLSVLALFLGCGSKEIAVVTPLLAILIDIFWFSDFSWEKFKPRLFYHAFYFLFTIFIMFHLLKPTFFRQLFSLGIESFNNRGNILTSNPMEKITAYQFLISEFSVMLHYLWIYICPLNLCVEYDFLLHRSIFDSVVLVPFFILAAISAFFAWLIQNKEYRPLSFGYFWFLIATLPRTTIIPSAELACDYKTYLASFGMFWMISFFIVKSCGYLSRFNFSINSIEKIRNYVIIFILAACTYLTFHRNKVWADAADFWKDIVLKNPGKPRPLNNYAVALTEKGEFDEAVKRFKESIALDSYYPDPLSNLAVVLSNQEKYSQAIEVLYKALEIIPDYPEAYNNLAAIFIKTNDIDRAIVNIAETILWKSIF
jgi:tetratricopeptide (TPR) repeat protein